MCVAEVAYLKHYTDFYKFPSCFMEASGCMSFDYQRQSPY